MSNHTQRFIWCEIVCCMCAASTAGRFTRGAIPRKEIDRDAKRGGWTYNGDWYCAKCTESLNSEP